MTFYTFFSLCKSDPTVYSFSLVIPIGIFTVFFNINVNEDEETGECVRITGQKRHAHTTAVYTQTLL